MEAGRLVDPQEVTDALTEYRNGMMIANHLRIAGQKGFDYKAAAGNNKENLKRALERASAKTGARAAGSKGINLGIARIADPETSPSSNCSRTRMIQFCPA